MPARPALHGEIQPLARPFPQGNTILSLKTASLFFQRFSGSNTPLHITASCRAWTALRS